MLDPLDDALDAKKPIRPRECAAADNETLVDWLIRTVHRGHISVTYDHPRGLGPIPSYLRESEKVIRKEIEGRMVNDG